MPAEEAKPPKVRGVVTRERIEKTVKEFFRDKKARPNYFRELVDIEDPYCTLDDDLTFDEVGRADLFNYLEEEFVFEAEDYFVFKVERLAQIYEYLDRRLIRGEPMLKPNIRYGVGKEESKSAYSGAKIGFLFPGQGAQKVGMAKDVVNEIPEAKALFDKAKTILGYDLWKICTEGPEDKLNSTEVSQPALLVASLAALEKMKREQPDAVKNCSAAAGLSLGEYTALIFAGAISFEDGLRLVKARAEAMQKAIEGKNTGMVSVFAMDKAQVEELLAKVSSKGRASIANYLNPGNIVVSGEEAALAAIEKECAAQSKMCKRLRVAGAFHSEFMAPAAAALKEALAKVTIKTPTVPVLSNVDAKFHSDPEEIRKILAEQLTASVLWEQSMNVLLDEKKIGKFFEIGTGNVLIGVMRHIMKKRDGNVDLKNISV